MSELFLTSPKIGDEGRELFERKFAEGDQVVTSQFRVDATLRRLHTYITENITSEDELLEVEALVEAHLAAALKSTSYEASQNTLHYFHLKIKHALIKQTVCAQYAFNKRERYELRRTLADGTYGAIASVLEEALEKYDSAYQDEISDLTGAINELTALALLNRRQTPERLAIPSDVTSDLYDATDLEYFTFTKGKIESTTYHIQVKTSNRHTDTIRMPIGGILITAEDMHNTHNGDTNFPMSRAIVAEVNALDTPKQEEFLITAVQSFDTHIRAGTKSSDIVYDTVSNIPEDILHGAMSAVRRIVERGLEDHPDATHLTFTIEHS